MLTFICYPKCTTCQKARKWLDENRVAYSLRDIKTENPTYDELAQWHKCSGLPLWASSQNEMEESASITSPEGAGVNRHTVAKHYEMIRGMVGFG